MPGHAHWMAGGFRDLLALGDRLEDLRFASGGEDVADGAAEQAGDDAGGGDEGPFLPQPRGDVVHDLQCDAVDFERPADLDGHGLAMQSADGQAAQRGHLHDGRVFVQGRDDLHDASEDSSREGALQQVDVGHAVEQRDDAGLWPDRRSERRDDRFQCWCLDCDDHELERTCVVQRSDGAHRVHDLHTGRAEVQTVGGELRGAALSDKERHVLPGGDESRPEGSAGGSCFDDEFSCLMSSFLR